MDEDHQRAGALGLVPAYAIQGDPVKTCAAYRDFPTRRKDADPDIPVLLRRPIETARIT